MFIKKKKQTNRKKNKTKQKKTPHTQPYHLPPFNFDYFNTIMVAMAPSTDLRKKNNDNESESAFVSVPITPVNSPPSRPKIPSSILASSISALCVDDRNFPGSLASLVVSPTQTIPLLPVGAAVTPPTRGKQEASSPDEARTDHHKHVHFIDDTSSTTELDYGYGDCGCDTHDSSSAVPRKRRRFERRNSKTSAMLLHAMSVVAAADKHQEDTFVPSSSLPLLPRNPSSGAVADDEFHQLYQSGIDIAETILRKMRIQHGQKHHVTALNLHPLRKFSQLK